MSVIFEAEVPCGVCGTPSAIEIELMWGEDDPWRRYHRGSNIKWKRHWRTKVVPDFGVRLPELDPVWVHGVGRRACHGGEDFLIEVRQNRIRSVRAIPAVPPRLLSFGWFGTQRELFRCTSDGPTRTWPSALTADDHQWLRTLAQQDLGR